MLFLGLPGEECHYTIRVGSEDFAFGGMTFLMVPATLSQLEEIAKLSERKDDLEDNYNKLSGSIDSLLDAMTAMTGSLNASANGLEQLNKARGIFSDGKGVIYSGTDALREDLSNLMAVYEKLGFLVDEQVIREYIHHADVAEDVAAYLDLYRKYQDDYGIPQILDGCVRPEIYARIYAAAFDERLSVVHLLLDGLAAFFGRAASERALTDAWYAFLKEYRSQVETAGDPAECYRTLVAEREQEMLRQIANDAYTREEAKREKLLLEKLKAAQQEVTKDSAQSCFEAAKVGFDRQREVLVQTEEAAGAALEHAFDFMEQAFEDGQEMVVFVNELALGPDSAPFLAENDCERFEQYSQKLLLQGGEDELLAELQRDDVRAGEHSAEF